MVLSDVPLLIDATYSYISLLVLLKNIILCLIYFVPCMCRQSYTCTDTYINVTENMLKIKLKSRNKEYRMFFKNQERKKVPDFEGVSAFLVHKAHTWLLKKHCSRINFCV